MRPELSFAVGLNPAYLSERYCRFFGRCFLQQAIQTALRKNDPGGERLRDGEIHGTAHGLIDETGESFDRSASAISWQLLLDHPPNLALHHIG